MAKLPIERQLSTKSFCVSREKSFSTEKKLEAASEVVLKMDEDESASNGNFSVSLSALVSLRGTSLPP